MSTVISNNDSFVLCQNKYSASFPDFPAFTMLTTILYGDCGYGNGSEEILRSKRMAKEAGAGRFFKLRAKNNSMIRVVKPDCFEINYHDCHGLICFNNGLRTALLSNTADCPIVFLTTINRRFIGLIHCGWRQLFEMNIPHAIDIIREVGDIYPNEIAAAVWPGICVGCYTVGPEFKEYFPGRVENGHFNLAEQVFSQLELAGVYNITSAKPAKFCSAHSVANNGDFLFHSRRREKNGCMNSALIAF